MIVGKTQIRIIYADTDQMGVVYNSRYFEFFERGRTELLRDLDSPYVEMEKSGIGLPVVEAHCRYIQGPRYDDVIVVKSIISEIPRSTIRIEYELYNESETILLASGHTVHCFVNPRGRPIKPPKSFVELIRRHIEVAREGLRREKRDGMEK
jgi:acyl-CoA thioester hydrolase